MTSPGPVEREAVAFEELLDRIGRRFARAEPRLRAREFVWGLLAPLARKNSWALAEYAGESNPSGMQRLLNSACDLPCHPDRVWQKSWRPACDPG